ncbi:extracellular solute-binding protein [Saccharopolyspora sp. K220]|uniref:ABC transporter substrate-binding protein n=1 Tax=Saccharopolyspora soli TaxID=2926618 RepID=UPI001F581D83|nr:extracellular solute-binding protein [Saccharopolyspora soli]MCI2418774.1 extracellular solute-binding protein [Saccharopolyspora soli]
MRTSRRSPRPTVFRLAAALLGAAVLTTACSTDSADDGPVTIRFSWWGNEERAEATNQAVDAFEAANPGITVETESIDFNSYFDRLATSVAAGDEPDVITMGGAYPREYADRGVLLDLAEIPGQLDLNALDKSALAGGNFDNKQYGVPTGVNTFGVIANPALFAAAGVALPDDNTWSWQDYARIATEISAKSPQGTFGSEDPTTSDSLDLYANQQTGQGLYSPAGGIAIQPGTAQQWWKMTTGLMSAGATPPASTTAELAGQPAPEQTLMGRGLAAMKFGWSSLLPAYRQASGADLIMLRAPGETTAQGTGMWLQASQLYTISKRSEHPEAAAKLVNFLISDPRAAENIKTDRGIPANPALRDHLARNLDASRKIEFDFVDRMSGLVDGDFVIGPTGSTETVGILTRINDSVLFGRVPPAQAANQFVAEITDAVS